MKLTRENLGLPVLLYFLFLSRTATSSELGSWCETDVDCHSPLLHCSDYECSCWPPYIPDATNKVCSIVIGGKCERFHDVCYDVNAACSKPASIWDSSYCVCNSGFLPHPETGVCRPGLGSNCTSDGLACLAGNCIDGICGCDGGLVPSQNNDRCGIATGGSCASNQICADAAAHCNADTEICGCKEGYQSVIGNENNLAICKLALGAACNATNECGPLNANCEILRYGTSACTCLPGYVPSPSRTSCLPVADHWPGACEDDLQCSAMFGRYSACQNNVCVCRSGYIYQSEDFGCVSRPVTPVVMRAPEYESIKLLATTLLPYLPSEVKLVVNDLLNEL